MSTAGASGGATFAELPRIAWRVSTRSDANHASCVEAGPVVDGSGRVAVRHSHHPGGAALVFGRDEWEAFLTGLKHDTFPA